ncbi:MAG: NAD(P)/FAD-dependent oxidoreductase, partial [Aestuariivirgaceae bacterium]
MSENLFTDDFKDQPFWWDRTPRPQLADDPLPAKADVAIIGSGYTGLNAAIQTARSGRRTLVLDAEAAGWGCSSRNGGQVSTSLKTGYHQLVKTYGEKLGYEIAREGHTALQWLGEHIENEGIDCDFKRVGRFYAAHSAAKYEWLANSLDQPPEGLETRSYLVPRAEQHSEIGSDFYHGGIVHPHHASLDPARYHQGLLEAATGSGAQIVPNCRVTGLRREADGFELETEKGRLTTRDVIVATSGYTGSLTPWHRCRIIPIGSYMIATEPLEDDLVAQLMPKGRVITDTRKLVVYYRVCPAHKRILFGARVAVSETDARAAAPALHAELARRFPQLQSRRISHAWMGFVGYTFDSMPHLGAHDGLYYA